MTLTKYPIPATHVAAVREAGFDMADANARHPVQNERAERILAARSGRQNPGLSGRAQQLLQGRSGKVLERALGRGFALAMFAAGLLADTPALACGDHPTLCPGVTSALNHMSTPAVQPELSDPARISLGLIGLFAVAVAARCLRRSYTHTKNTRKGQIMIEEFGDEITVDDRLEPSTKVEGADIDDASVTEEGSIDRIPPSSPFRCITDGASRVGKVRTENQDAFRLLRISGETAIDTTVSLAEGVSCMILCDGAGGVEGGKLAAELTASVLETQLRRLIAGNISPSIALLEDVISTARSAIAKAPDAGITTAIIAILHGREMHYATLGDGALTVFWPDGMVNQVLTPHHLRGQPSNVITGYVGQDCTTPPRVGHIRLEPGCTVMAMSDGASDLFPYDDFAENRTAFADLLRENDKPELANAFLTRLEDARDPDTNAYLHSDNMTLIMGHLLLNDEEADDE